MGRRLGKQIGKNKYDYDEGEYTENKSKNSSKSVFRFVIWSVLFVLVAYQLVMLVGYTIGKVDKSKVWVYNAAYKVMGFITSKTADKEETEKYELKLAALGDVYATSSAITAAKTGSSYDFLEGLDSVKEILKNYDVVVASLNTPVAGSALSYSNASTYNSPSQILDMLKELGVSNVATATSHIYDKTKTGITNTIKTLEEYEINQVGITNSDKSLPVIISKNEIKIGMLSYLTESNVKITTETSNMLNIYTNTKLKEDMAYLKENNVDYVIAYLSIPDESTMVTADQKEIVEELFSEGVNVVFGTGSSVVKEKSEDIYEVGDSSNHVYAIYSLGDFYGSANTIESDISVIGDIKFTKTKTIVKDRKGQVTSEKSSTNMVINQPVVIYSDIKKDKSRELYTIDKVEEAYSQDDLYLTKTEYTSLIDEKERIEELMK